MNYPTAHAEPTARHRRRTSLTKDVRGFPTERELHGAVSAFFARLGIPHRNQHAVGAGAADICLELPDGRPFALLELKNGLDADNLSLADAADHFEQAHKYRLESGLPVFLGPFFYESMGVVLNLLGGGARPKKIAALSALGGRADVGLFFLHAVKGCATNPVGWYGFQLLLRQSRIAAHGGIAETIWPTEPLALVNLRSAGSLKDRG
jgi:hypothetical protein